MKQEKTNVMRILDAKKIAYTPHCYLESGAIAAVDIAAALGQDAVRVFKTLVTVGKSGANYVFVIPAPAELDLKKAARAVGEKNIEMLKQKFLLPLTGYVHDGCSPIGMKKELPCVVHASAKDYATIFFSAGKIGYQVELSADALSAVRRVSFADLTVDGDIENA